MDCYTRSRSAFSCPLDFAAGSRYIDTSGSNPKPFAQTINSRNSSPESADSLEIMRTIKFPLPISSYVLSTALHPPSVCTRISGSLVSIFVFYQILYAYLQGLGYAVEHPECRIWQCAFHGFNAALCNPARFASSRIVIRRKIRNSRTLNLMRCTAPSARYFSAQSENYADGDLCRITHIWIISQALSRFGGTNGNFQHFSVLHKVSNAELCKLHRKL